MEERTFVMIKPDGVERGLIGEIISRIERRGMKIVAMKMVNVDERLAREQYSPHIGKSFFNELIRHITSGPSVVMVVEGRNAVSVMRSMIGATDPANASPGTIRGDLALDLTRNVVHAADSAESARREMKIYFPEL